MIDAKQAVQIAKQNALDLGQTPIALEELERDSYKGHDVWSITLSFPPRQQPTFMVIAGLPQYKRFLIDAETGELVAMKLREVASQ